MGVSRPGDMGFDIVHFNLHKSFTQPHGGGGPGAGPIAVSDRIEPYLPRPVVVRRAPEGNGSEAFYDLDYDRPKSIGRLRGFHGPTIYFPLIVDEALLIEPTETETKETLDRFADVVAEILEEARDDPEVARAAPYTTPVRRLDEAGAARRPVLRQPL